MKKLSIISEQIQNNTYSYTGKGSFEAVVKNNTDLVLSWLEDLVPIGIQIEKLNKLVNLEFQKRNYTRILTKLFPVPYTEFVSINILVRDSNIIAQYYNEEYNVTILFNNLIKGKYLKYPGKYEKYVEFDIFQKFIMLYRDDLLVSLEQPNSIQTIEESISIPDIVDEVEDESIEETPPAKIKKETNWTNLLLGKLK